MSKEKELGNALEYAYTIIEAYENEISNGQDEWFKKPGFCQGVIFKNARTRILKLAGITSHDLIEMAV